MKHCVLCGERSYAAADPVHTYDEEPDVVVPYTCEEPGGKVWYCTSCNIGHDPEAAGVYCEPVPAAHKFSDEVKYIASSCEKDGRFVRICSECGAEDVLQTDENAKATGHDWQYNHRSADCEHAEKYTISCQNCGKIRWEATAVLSQPLGHVKPENIEVLTPADCENAALIGWECGRCGAHIEEYDGEAAGHVTEVTVLSEPDCLNTGLADHICSICGEKIAENVVLPVSENCTPYQIIISPATCTENGIAEYRCITCDRHLYFSKIPFGHEAGDVETVTEPTCDTDGFGQVHCMVCGELLREMTLPALAHSYAGIPELRRKECTEESYAVITCTLCGEEKICAEDQETEEPRHQRAYRYAAPSCSSCGLLEVYCAICDEVLIRLDVLDDAALGHVCAEEVIVVEAPDCETGGLEATVCLRCNERLDVKTLPALGHMPEDRVTKESTCFESGMYDRVCVSCNKVLEENIVIAQKETCEKQLEVLIANSCAQDGLCQYICKWCDRHMGYSILPAGHQAGNANVVAEATCEKEGTEQVFCMLCSELLEERSTPVAEHAYDLENPSLTVPATCTEPSKLIYYCTVCNANGENEDGTYTAEAGACLGHKWNEETVHLDADCVTPGRAAKTCSVCGEHHVISYERTEPALGHMLSYQLIQPTCTQPMYVSGVCTVCGYEIEKEPAQEIQGIATGALGHVEPETWEVIAEPTCLTTGIRVKHCLACGEEIAREEIACVPCAEELECVVQEADCSLGLSRVALMRCQWCEKITGAVVEPAQHVYSDENSVVLLASGCDTEGIMMKVCDICGFEVRETMPATGHTAGDPRAVEADCDTCARIVVSCTVCAEILNVEAEIGEPLGHEFRVYDPAIGKNVCIYCREVQGE